MIRKVIFFISLSLFFNIILYGQIPSVQNAKVKAQVSYDETTGIYTYNYIIINAQDQTLPITQIAINASAHEGYCALGDWDSLPHEERFPMPTKPFVPPDYPNEYSAQTQLEIVERDNQVFVVPFGSFSPTGWSSRLVPEDEYVSLLHVGASLTWGASPVNAIQPGQSLSGFQANSYGLPSIREIVFRPDYKHMIIEEDGPIPPDWFPDEEDLDTAEYGDKLAEAMKKVEESVCYKTETIGFSGSPCPFVAVDFIAKIQDYINQSQNLNWLVDANLAASLNDLLDQILQAILQEDYTQAQLLLQDFMQLVQNSTADQLSSEAEGLLYYNAKYLYDEITWGIQEIVELKPLNSEHSLNEIHQAIITVKRGIQPIPNHWVHGDIISGPHEGEHQEGVTDENGQFLFSYRGIKEGTDKLIASIHPPAFHSISNKKMQIMQNNWESAPALITWKGGPDLAIYSLFPPLIRIPAKVNAIPIKESTINIGTTSAPQSKTRYYLSSDQKVDQDDYILYEREVPPLEPNQISEYSADIPFPDLNAGDYWLLACADADNEIAELNETNNCDRIVAEVFFIVQKVENQPPQAQDQQIILEMDSSINIIIVAIDPDGDPLTYSIVSQPSHGTLNGIAPNLSYIPATHYYGTDSFTFKANDGQADSNVATVSITISHVNHAPVAQNQSVITDEDVSVNITLIATDIDNDPLTYSIVSQPSHGTLSGTAPNLTYTPATHYHSTDSFTFKANDGQVDSNVATASITINHINHAPVAQNQSATTDEDVSVNIILAAIDIDNDSLTYIIVSQPSHGTLSGTAPNLTYAPATHYYGTDSFTFKANDGQVDSNVATVSITINHVNHAPVAQDQSVTTDEDTAKSITLIATDVDGDALTYSIVAQPSHGTLSGTPPNLTYTPATHYYGTDSFTFKANDGQVDSNIAIVSITINHVNHAPVAQDQSVTTDEDTAKSITLVATDVDGDALTYSIVTQPSHGTLSGTPPNVTYTPATHYYGSDSFTFKANDGQIDSNIATVSITINHINHAPVAQNQSVATNEDISANITLISTDIDNDPLTYSIVSQPAHGTLSGIAPNLIYTPALHYHGADSFTFKANDGQVDSNIATVSITINHVNHAPVAQNQSVTTDEDTAKSITLVATDVDGDALTYSIVTQPSHGTLSGTPPNVIYTPATHYYGTDSFTFKANDGQVDSNIATISITINQSGNQPPDCTHAQASPSSLWPPNHKWRSIQITGVTDPAGGNVNIQVTSIFQDEPVNGQGDGDTSPDGIKSPLQVRSERSGTGNGRVYHIYFTGTDPQGGQCSGEVQVCVPHDQGQQSVCVDEGPLYDSTQQ